MAFVSFEMVQQLLKGCEGKTFLEAMDSVAIGGYLPNGRIMVDRDGKVTAIDAFPVQVYKASPEMKAILGKDGDAQKKELARTPPVPSTPKTSEADRMWNLVVLAARSSRYEE